MSGRRRGVAFGAFFEGSVLALLAAPCPAEASGGPAFPPLSRPWSKMATAPAPPPRGVPARALAAVCAAATFKAATVAAASLLAATSFLPCPPWGAARPCGAVSFLLTLG